MPPDLRQGALDAEGGIRGWDGDHGTAYATVGSGGGAYRLVNLCVMNQSTMYSEVLYMQQVKDRPEMDAAVFMQCIGQYIVPWRCGALQYERALINASCGSSGRSGNSPGHECVWSQEAAVVVH